MEKTEVMKHSKEPWNYIGEEAIPCPEQMGDNEWVEGKSQSLPGFGFQDSHQEIEDMFRGGLKMEKTELMKRYEAETGKEAIDYLTEYPFDDYTRWLEAKATAYDRLMSALTSILVKAKEVEDLSPSNVDWWCPNCGTTDCTYDGRCTKCGAEIEQFQVEPFKDSLHELIDGLLSVLPDGFESAIHSKVKSKDIPPREDV